MTSLILGALIVTAPSPNPTVATYTIHPERTRQTIENFGASDSWTVEPLYRWPERTRQKVADLLFDRKVGAGLSAWRFNIGGGINHETIDNPLRTAETFQVREGVYDWSRVPGQRWMLEAARRAGVPSFIAYAVTPPRNLTRNGFTNGTDGQGSTNLISGKEAAYAKYLVDIVEHFRDRGYNFTHLSPINEPDHEWNKGSQEGNRASNDDVAAIGSAVAAELERRKMGVSLLTPEASSPQIGYEPNTNMSRKYGTPYGNYADFLANRQDWRNEAKPVYAYHSYWADRFNELIPNRRKLRTALDKVPDLTVWQTEYCQMVGPRGEGGWGRDLGMTLALNTARIIHLDLTIVEASAWQWWLGVSNSDYKDGLVYVDGLDRPDGEVFGSKTLYALGNFARFVRPGYRRIEVDGNGDQPWGTLVSAYIDPSDDEIIAVAINTETSPAEIRLDLPGNWGAVPHITSDRPKDDIRRLPQIDLRKPVVVPSRSIVTYVCRKR